MNICQVMSDLFLSPYVRVQCQNCPLKFPVNTATPVRCTTASTSVSPCPPSVDQSSTFIYQPSRGVPLEAYYRRQIHWDISAFPFQESI